MWYLIALAAMAADPSPQAQQISATIVPVVVRTSGIASVPRARATSSPGGPSFAESANFLIRSYVGHLHAEELALHCESVHSQLRKQWPNHGSASWHPKCEVFIHPSYASYLHAVGPGGAQTLGSSAVQIHRGQVTSRRIDLLAQDGSNALPAFRHELIHVLFADLFPKTAPPRWAEEGLALLNDSEEKQRRHVRDLHSALLHQRTLPLDQLFGIARYPADWQRAVFYAQSMSVVGYLTQLGTHQEFLRFVKVSTSAGYDNALKIVYEIDGTGELERRWREYVRSLGTG